jgi:hypothetical protein
VGVSVLRIQIGGILEQEGSNPVTFVSNYDWDRHDERIGLPA